VIVGADTDQHLRGNVNALVSPVLDEAEVGALERAAGAPGVRSAEAAEAHRIVGGKAIGQRAAL